MEMREIRPFDIRFLDVCEYINNYRIPTVVNYRHKIENYALYDTSTNLIYPIFCPIDIAFIYGDACLNCPLCGKSYRDDGFVLDIWDNGPSNIIESMHKITVGCQYHNKMFDSCCGAQYYLFPVGKIIPPEDVLNLPGVLEHYNITLWKLDLDSAKKLGDYAVRLYEVVEDKKRELNI